MSNYEVVNNRDGTITISEKYFDELFGDHLFLNALRNNGVDNWEGYSESQAEHYSDDEDE